MGRVRFEGFGFGWGGEGGDMGGGKERISLDRYLLYFIILLFSESSFSNKVLS